VSKDKVYIHFIADNTVRFSSAQKFVPRVGDECRFSDDNVYRVDRVVWVYDEPGCPYARVNIGITPVE